MRDRLGATFEIKTVDGDERVIEGYAAVHSNVDRVDDILDVKALAGVGSKPPASIAVFIGHDSRALPVGIPLEVRADGTGLYTKTKVFNTSAGDDLLQVARELQEHGQTLGMSIGYNVVDRRFEKVGGKTIRRLLDVDVQEYSFAAPQTIANPKALVTSVKAMTEGIGTAGGMLTDDGLASLHGMMDGLRAVHDASCTDADCPHRGPADKKADADPADEEKAKEPADEQTDADAEKPKPDQDRDQQAGDEEKTASDDYARRVALLDLDLALAHT